MGAEVALAVLPRTLQGRGPAGVPWGLWVGTGAGTGWCSKQQRCRVEGSRHVGG